MEKEDVLLLAQLFHSMEEAVNKMEKYHAEQNYAKLEAAKREAMDLQLKIAQILEK